MTSTSIAPERGRSTLRRLTVGLVLPAMVAFGALVAVAAPASAAPVTPAAGSAVATESFTGSTVTDGAWQALGDGCLTRATVAPAAGASSLGVCALRVGSPSAKASTGYLQLTDATGYRKGGAVYTKASPSALGLDVTFDQWQFGTAGYGGDGLAFFLADGATKITSTGGQGGALGYAQDTNMPPAPNGLAGGYLGVGLDAHGVFASSGDGHGTGCATGQSAALQANSVVLRGPGSGKTGYCFLASTNLPTASQKLHVVLNDPGVMTPAVARKFRVTVSADRFPTVTVYAAFPANADLKQVLQYTMTDAAPASYQFGFTASSGSVVDTHLIGNVSASTIKPVTPVDTTAPVVTITGGANALVATTTPKLSGTSDEASGSTVTVLAGSQKLSATVGADGTWSVTPAELAQGPVKVSASATDAAGNTGTATQALTVDTIAPAVTITGGASATAASGTPTVAGTTDAPQGTAVDVKVGDQALTATVQADGTWSVTPETLDNGAVTISATATDPAGNIGTATQQLTIAVTPTITISGGVKALSNLATPTISGKSTGVGGRTVTVSVSGQNLTGTISRSGDWSVVTKTLTQGSHPVVAVVTGLNSLKVSSSQTLTVDTIAPAIVIAGGSTVSTRIATPTITGRTDVPAGGKLKVVVDDVVREAVVSPTRTWSVTSSRLTAGTHTVVVSATDAAGNTGTQRQRLTLVPVLAIDGGASRLTNDPTPTITGTSDAPSGTPVTVTIAGQTLNGTVTATGTWSVTTRPLPSTVYAMVVGVRDAAHNLRTARQSLTVDTIAPAIVINGGSMVSTKTATPTISGRVNVPAGSTIKVAVDGVSRDVAVSSTRTWTTTSQHLTAGAHTVVVTATDAAGNVGTQRQRLTVIG